MNKTQEVGICGTGGGIKTPDTEVFMISQLKGRNKDAVEDPQPEVRLTSEMGTFGGLVDDPSDTSKYSKLQYKYNTLSKLLSGQMNYVKPIIDNGLFDVCDKLLQNNIITLRDCVLKLQEEVSMIRGSHALKTIDHKLNEHWDYIEGENLPIGRYDTVNIQYDEIMKRVITITKVSISHIEHEIVKYEHMLEKSKSK